MGCPVKVQWIGIEKLKPYWRNPRRRSEDSIRKIADSIAAFGWQQPIVVDKEYVVIIGHGRLEAAKLLEAKQVPVVVAGNLAPEKVKALRLADNRTNRDSDWDIGLLAQEIKELRGLDVQLIGHAGFTEDDLKRIADDLDEAALEKIAGAEAGEDEGSFEADQVDGAPGDGRQGDGNPLVTFSEVLSFEQRNVVNAAIQLAKQRERFKRRGDALFHICELYLEEHDEKF
jgi:ParB-like chromosome segregation protein Spo0J